jgi:hypothetical protein
MYQLAPEFTELDKDELNLVEMQHLRKLISKRVEMQRNRNKSIEREIGFTVDRMTRIFKKTKNVRKKVVKNDYIEFKRTNCDVSPLNFVEKITEYYGILPEPPMRRYEEVVRKSVFSADGRREQKNLIIRDPRKSNDYFSPKKDFRNSNMTIKKEKLPEVLRSLQTAGVNDRKKIKFKE